MCLDMRFEPETERKMQAKLPDGLITVYRWVEIKPTGGYKALWTDYSFFTGLNRATHLHDGGQMELNGLYRAGFHSYKSKMGAKWAGPMKNCGRIFLIKAQIRKDWIGAIGKTGKCVVFVTDRIISPSYRNELAVVE